MTLRVIEEELGRLHGRHQLDNSGALADYIPELNKADPSWFGISLCTVDGSIHSVGDVEEPFTIQSVSKPFVFALALADHGSDALLQRVGVEPSGNSFNSILLDGSDRPHNAMVNAGAIATVGFVAGKGPHDRFERILDTLSAFAGRQLDVDEAVFESERTTGHRNRAIAHLLKNVGVVIEDVDEVLEVYFRQCSIRVTSRDLAVMAASFAAGGRNPVTGRRVIAESAVADVLSVMYTAGMYDYSGEWAYRTGLPAKSGVSGGVMALVSGQVGVGAYSPLVDDRGNSVRGVKVCEELSRRFGLHLFRTAHETLPPIRTLADGSARRSVRVRPASEVAQLDADGRAIGVVVAQGHWSFVACERLLAGLDGASHHFVVIETSRISGVDATAAVLIDDFVSGEGGPEVVLAGTVPAGLAKLDVVRFATVDEALEWCEDRVLAGESGSEDEMVTPDASDLAQGLPQSDLERLSSHVVERVVAAGESVDMAGRSARSVFLVGSGHLSAFVEGRRVAAFGPGGVFGEVAYLTGATRSAEVVADTATRLWELADLDDLPPDTLGRIHRRMAVVLAERLATTNRLLVEADR